MARRLGDAAKVINYDEVEDSGTTNGKEDADSKESSSTNGFVISHARSKSAPAMQDKNGKVQGAESDDDDSDVGDEVDGKANGSRVKGAEANGTAAAASSNQNSERNGKASAENLYDMPEGEAEDYLAIYETLDRVKSKSTKRYQDSADLKNKSHSMEALETPTPSLKSFEFPEAATEASNDKQQQPRDESASTGPALPRRRHRSKPQTEAALARQTEHRRSAHELSRSKQPQQQEPQPQPRPQQPLPTTDAVNGSQSMASFLKKALRIEGPQLLQRTVTIKKNVRESLGMRIGGGIGSNEGDTPIYIANIHPHGCIGKSKQMKVSRDPQNWFCFCVS